MKEFELNNSWGTPQHSVDVFTYQEEVGAGMAMNQQLFDERNNGIVQKIANTVSLWVVGNKFNKHCEHKTIISLSELEILIYSDIIKDDTKKYVINIGQGVNPLQLKGIIEDIESFGLSHLVTIISPIFYNRCAKNLAHKNKIEDVIISKPIKCNDNNYLCELMLTESWIENTCGKAMSNVPYKALLEAADQTMKAVTEKYYVKNCTKGKLNFFIQSLEMRSFQLIYPLSVMIRYQIIAMQIKENHHEFEALLSFIQKGELVGEIAIGFSAMA